MSTGNGYREALTQRDRMIAGSWRALRGSALVTYLARRSHEGNLTAGEEYAIAGLGVTARDVLAHEIRLLERS
jgi:hypothetical protein